MSIFKSLFGKKKEDPAREALLKNTLYEALVVHNNEGSPATQRAIYESLVNGVEIIVPIQGEGIAPLNRPGLRRVDANADFDFPMYDSESGRVFFAFTNVPAFFAWAQEGAKFLKIDCREYLKRIQSKGFQYLVINPSSELTFPVASPEVEVMAEGQVPENVQPPAIKVVPKAAPKVQSVAFPEPEKITVAYPLPENQAEESKNSESYFPLPHSDEEDKSKDTIFLEELQAVSDAESGTYKGRSITEENFGEETDGPAETFSSEKPDELPELKDFHFPQVMQENAPEHEVIKPRTSAAPKPAPIPEGTQMQIEVPDNPPPIALLNSLRQELFDYSSVTEAWIVSMRLEGAARPVLTLGLLFQDEKVAASQMDKVVRGIAPAVRRYASREHPVDIVCLNSPGLYETVSRLEEGMFYRRGALFV